MRKKLNLGTFEEIMSREGKYVNEERGVHIRLADGFFRANIRGVVRVYERSRDAWRAI